MIEQPKNAHFSSINWIAFFGGMYAFLSLVHEFYITGKIDIDENTLENLCYFTASVAIFIRRTYFEVRPVTKPKYLLKK